MIFSSAELRLTAPRTIHDDEEPTPANAMTLLNNGVRTYAILFDFISSAGLWLWGNGCGRRLQTSNILCHGLASQAFLSSQMCTVRSIVIKSFLFWIENLGDLTLSLRYWHRLPELKFASDGLIQDVIDHMVFTSAAREFVFNSFLAQCENFSVFWTRFKEILVFHRRCKTFWPFHSRTRLRRSKISCLILH